MMQTGDGRTAVGGNVFEGRKIAMGLALWLALFAGNASAQAPVVPGMPPGVPPLPGAAPAATTPAGTPNVQTGDDGLVQLDFADVELNAVIDTIARLTGKNFIYDDRVRGRVTIVSPTRVSLEQAYAVFESVLQVKGFTTVDGPGGSIKVIPVRDAKENAIGTVPGPTPTPNSDVFVTRLIPLRYIDAEAITNSLKPLVSKDAAMVAYPPTNTIILTDASSNIRRVLSILEAIDVETYKEELAVLKVQHADAGALAQQLGEIYGAEVAGNPGQPGGLTPRIRQPQVPGQPPQVQSGEVQRDRVRIITDARTNSLIVLASRTRLADIRRLVQKLDVPVTGGGRIHVYYLKNADSEELADTLGALISGQPRAPSSGGKGAKGAQGGAGGLAAAAQAAQAQALRAAVTELSEGVTVTADKGTNALIIQASQEGFATIAQVIEKLDIRRPQVLVEALIMEVAVSNNEDLGFNGIYRVITDGMDVGLTSVTDSDSTSLLGAAAAAGTGGTSAITGLLANAVMNEILDSDGKPIEGQTGRFIQGVIKAAAGNSSANILSAPHILTTDNEEAEIKIGNNIPIVSSRVQSAAGIEQSNTGNLATSVNIERQDIGITLRVTPQISEGDTLRLEIFQEISDVNTALTNTVAGAGGASQTGVALSNRKVENTVVVKDGETVAIGGLISDQFQDTVDKVPWLGDIPFLGWAFKTTGQSLRKVNLLVFLTPTIVREPEDLERASIRKREEFRQRSTEAMNLDEDRRTRELEHYESAKEVGLDFDAGEYKNPAAGAVTRHEKRYPLERMREIEAIQRGRAARTQEEIGAARSGPQYVVLAAIYRDEHDAAGKLQELIDAGFDATIVSVESGGAVVYEIHVGPFTTNEAANEAAGRLRQTFGLSPSVLVQEASAR